jgi:hypothetical protein
VTYRPGSGGIAELPNANRIRMTEIHKRPDTLNVKKTVSISSGGLPSSHRKWFACADNSHLTFCQETDHRHHK